MSLFAEDSNKMTPQIIPVDTEHIGIRLLVPFLTVAGLIGGFMLGSAILQEVAPSVSGLCLGIPMALVVTGVLLEFTDKLIKPRWSSGRHLVHDHQLTLVDNRKGKARETVFNWNEPLVSTMWYFEVPTRKARVPQGWYCTSLRLAQNDTQVVIYTFMSPEQAREVTGFHQHFLLLSKQKSTGLSQSAINSKSEIQQSARNKRLREYENERWHDGAEISAEAFALIVADVVMNAD